MRSAQKKKFTAKKETKKEVTNEKPPPKKQKTVETKPREPVPTTLPNTNSPPVRNKQQQREDTTEKITNLDTEPPPQKTTMQSDPYRIEDASAAEWGIEEIKANLDKASKPLQDFLDFTAGGKNCQFILNVNSAMQTGHGDTGVYVRDPAGQKQWLLIQEALLFRPDLIIKPQGFRVEATVGASDESPPVEAPTTLLHELELHVVPAGQLIMNMAKLGGGEPLLDLVLDYMRRIDDHTNLDVQEQYVRTAARILEQAETDSFEWAAQLFKNVSKDALGQFSAYAFMSAADKTTAVAAGEWLRILVDGIEKHKNSRITLKAPKPGVPQILVSGTPSTADIDPAKVLGYLADQVSNRTKMIDIVADARARLGLPVSAVVDLYRTTVVPALLQQAPDGLTSDKQRIFFLTYHGVPPNVALEAVDAAYSTMTQTTPQLKIKTAWPEEPVFWLTSDEEENWDYQEGAPTELTTATNLVHGKYVLIDGERYRVAVTDAKMDPKKTRLKSTYNPVMKKWITLTKPVR